MTQEIVLRSVNEPRQAGLKEEISWICESLGIGSGRDTKGTAPSIVLSLLERFESEPAISSGTLAQALKISSGTVNHHVRHLVQAGLLYREKKLICLRGGSLAQALREMRKDAQRIFDDLLVTAKEIDKQVGLD